MIAHPIGSTARPLSVAVIGSGPAGFYTVEALLKRTDLAVQVDLFERLPAPYGLVRYGVAPDHQKIKSVTVAYDRLAADPRVRFLGNVHVGQGDLSVEELAQLYDQIVFAVGCGTDQHLKIPGEELAGSDAATSFVAWYNGHPDFVGHHVDLDTDRAVVIGVGDVSMDLTRMLLQDVGDLSKTDVTDYALETFRKSRVREVVVLGRRGPAQAAFATKELEDIANLPGLAVSVDARQVQADLESGEALDGLVKRKLEYLGKLAREDGAGAPKRMILRFLASPVRLLGEGGRVHGIEIEHNEIVTGANGKPAARGTGRFETISTGLVLRAVGYRGVAIPGLPFDERLGIVPNGEGRVLRDSQPWPGVFVAGWIKRGPSGVIGTNKSDAAATVQRMLEDISGHVAPAKGSRAAVDALLRDRGVRVITWADWKRLDVMERERGRERGKVRDKLTRMDEVLTALG